MDTIIVVVVVASIGAVAGLAVVIVIVATAIDIIEFLVTSRPPKSPTRAEVPARQRGLGDAVGSPHR
eukprot:4951093-Pyramimonas_sp.AAC.1